MYNGLVIDGAPSYIIYHLTHAKTIAKLVNKAGVNTAGVGVCFLSRRQWCSTIQQAGYRILDYTGDNIWHVPWTWTVLLHIGRIRRGHFWLAQ